MNQKHQAGRGLFGIRLLILHFKFQFSKSIKSLTFHIFLTLTYPLRQNISFPKCLKSPKNLHQTVVNEVSIEIQRRLKRERDIGRKAVLSDVNTAFTCTPALSSLLSPSAFRRLSPETNFVVIGCKVSRFKYMLSPQP